MKKLNPIMFVGTGSDVGKSVINAAFCRIFRQDGYRPAPFKAQNMSLNSYATPDGFEIGRAQAVQAEACGIDCCVEMNPILLKPTSYLDSQVVLHGKPIGNQSANEYFNKTDRDKLFKEAMKAYNRLRINFNPIVMEGAGSISEINLWDKDITNMKVAYKTGASTYLIADIDRGGVFASVFGTIQLLPEKHKELIKGIIINKFRGDISLFEKGKTILEELTGIPVVGIIPYFKDIFIEQEDSVVIENTSGSAKEGKINIAVILLKHMSNFTDFNRLEQMPDVHLYYTASANDISRADIVIIPGSKNTIADLTYLRNSGIAKEIIQMHKDGKQIYGICGGFQMMGKEIRDPHHVEGEVETMPGLGLLPIITSLAETKKTEQCQFIFLNEKETCQGYEIHMGNTITEKKSPLCIINENEKEGYFLNPKTWGTYIHGIFDNNPVIEYVLQQVNHEIKVTSDFTQYKNENFNKLADLVRENVDMNYIYNSLKK